MESFSFRTRARAVDHLGRGQIADCPTAVSELWKNSWDAYARKVELHIYPGVDATSHSTAALYDNGFGMTKEEFRTKWLVIGTDSKIEDINQSAIERFGLDVRPKQGEKGIGRLSVAFLAPITLVVSTKTDGSCFASLVDWRLFENPHLELDDIRIGVVDLERPESVVDKLNDLVKILLDNLTGTRGDIQRKKRIQTAWTLWDQQAASLGLNSTSEHIIDSLAGVRLAKERVYDWRELMEQDDNQTHGMALFLFDIHNALGMWLEPEGQDDSQVMRDQFRRKLRGFIDPFDEPKDAEAAKRQEFLYGAYYHIGKSSRKIVDNDYAVGLERFLALEHNVLGRFDEEGYFKGEVTVYQKKIGNITIPPQIKVYGKNAQSYVGPFDFMIGRFELDEKGSTHSKQELDALKVDLGNHAGLCIYRNKLRVMPYGLEEYDFLKIERRRSQNAGRHFWSVRHIFGKIGLSTTVNPNLRDKAGREGLVDNRASHIMRQLVEHALIELADKYFGTKSDIRKKVKNKLKIEKEERDRKLAEERLRKQFRKDFKKNQPLLGTLWKDFKNSESLPYRDQWAAIGKISTASKELQMTPPSDLGSLEEQYRDYRDSLFELREKIALAQKELGARAEFIFSSPKETLDKYFESFRERLSSTIQKYKHQTDDLILDLGTRMPQIEEKYLSQLEELEQTSKTRIQVRPTDTLEEVNAKFEELEELLTYECLNFAGTLEQMLQGSDLVSTVKLTIEERNEFAQKLQDYTQLAQTGLAIEIIGHELSSLTDRIEHGFAKVEKKDKAVKDAYEAHKDLTRQLKFLAPLEISRYRSRELIQGQDIAEFLERFFEDKFSRNSIELIVTEPFKGIRFRDLQSRIYPVFINLINNAIYWLQPKDDRKILLDFSDGKTIVADSGLGVDIDDRKRLFELFFTKRTEGRGIGLYLCKQNLAVTRHKIRYASDEQNDPVPLPGASFIIEFSNLEK